MSDNVLEFGRAIVTLQVDRVRPCKGQPRKYFNPHKLRKLAKSLERSGQKQAILVHPIDDDPEHDYEIVDGERRWRAKRKAGIKTIAGIIINAEDTDEYFEISAVSNFGREDHTPLEIASALRRVRERHKRIDGKCTETDLAEIFGKDQTWISHHLDLLKLTKEVQGMLNPELPRAERLSRTAAVQVSRLPPNMQMPFAKRILAQRLSMNEIRLNVHQELEAKNGGAPLVLRGRPSDRFHNLRTLLRHFNSGAKVLMSVDPNELRIALGNRELKEIVELRAMFDECEAREKQLRAFVDGKSERLLASVR